MRPHYKKGLVSPPTETQYIGIGQVLKGIKALCKLACTGVESKYIFAGNSNNMALPESTNEYVVFTVISQKDIGQPIIREVLSEDESSISLNARRTVALMVQIDCYSDNDELARIRAENLAVLSRTTPGVDFLKKFDISLLYAEDPKNTTLVVDANQYVQRWTVYLHISYEHILEIDVDSFTEVEYDVENVDVKFPPIN